MYENRLWKICFIGITGSGKSALGNVIFGRDPDGGDKGGFQTSNSATGSVSDVQIREGYWLGKEDSGIRVRIIDTPGFGKGETEDKQIIEKIVEALRRDETVDAFILVKNSQQPRYDQQEAEFFQMLSDTVGNGLFKNLIVVFSRWSFSQQEERRRQRNRSAITLEEVKEELWKSIVRHHEECRGRARVPMMALDSFYEPEEADEFSKFHEAAGNLWNTISHFQALEVRNIKAGLTKMEKLKSEIFKLEVAKKEREEAIRKQLAKFAYPFAGILGLILTFSAWMKGLPATGAICLGLGQGASVVVAAAGWTQVGAVGTFLSGAFAGFPTLGAIGAFICAASGGRHLAGAVGASLARFAWQCYLVNK